MTKGTDKTTVYTPRRRKSGEEPHRVLPRGMLTGFALVVLASVIWYAYPHKRAQYQTLDIPVITADNAPYKFKPDDPGGMDIRHRDSTVFDPLENKSPDKVEKLAPPAEKPMSRDKAVALARAQDKLPAPAPKTGMEVKTLPDGTEKIVTAPAHKAAPVPAHVEKTPAVKTVKKPAAKAVATPAAKPAPVKTAKETVKKAVAPITPGVAATANGVYIQLGSFRDISAAYREWTKLQKKYPQYLSHLTLRTQRVDLGAKGVYNRLQAGRVSRADAKKICAALKASHSAGCIIVP